MKGDEIMSYKYNGITFTDSQGDIVSYAIRNEFSLDIIDIITTVDKEGVPVFISGQMNQICRGAKDGLSIEQIKIYTKLNKNMEPIYETDHMAAIRDAIKYKIPKEYIDIICKLNKNGKPIFNSLEMRIILESAKLRFPAWQIDLFTQINPTTEKPIFSYPQMTSIYNGIRKGLKDEEIKFITKLDSCYRPIYEYTRMDLLVTAFKNNLPKEYIDLVTQINFKTKRPIFDIDKSDFIMECYKNKVDKSIIELITKLNNNNEPVFSSSKMKIIYECSRRKYNKEQIDLITRLNNCGCSVYEFEQMKAIMVCYRDKLSFKDIELIAKLDENFNPIHSGNEMTKLNDFFKTSDEKRSQLIRNCINNNMHHLRYMFLVDKKIPIEKMRICISLYEFNCGRRRIELLSGPKFSYDDVKYVKYLLRCAKEYNISGRTIIDLENPTLENIKKNLIELICKRNKLDIDAYDVVDKCISSNMLPEEILFITTSGFSIDEMKNITIALLDGEDFKKLKEDHDLSKQILNNDSINYNTSEKSYSIIEKER